MPVRKADLQNKYSWLEANCMLQPILILQEIFEFRIPAVPWRNRLKASWTRLLFICCQNFAILVYTEGTVELRKIIKNIKYVSKNEEKPCSTCLQPIYPWYYRYQKLVLFQVPVCSTTNKNIFLFSQSDTTTIIIFVLLPSKTYCDTPFQFSYRVLIVNLLQNCHVQSGLGFLEIDNFASNYYTTK